jgi:molybdate transport system ATP-binding protein
LDVAFEAPMQGVTALFGPSGCGKTTILRCIAGLQRLSGHLSVNGKIWQDSRRGVFRKPHERQIGYVFQEPSLFPHLTVRDNLLYGARRAVQNGAGQIIKEDEVVALLGIERLLARAPHALSGGERQRVAVGRALLSQPRLLLMDEPLAALDRASKDEILPYFEALHAHLSIPIFYVSHDLSEIERLADTLILLNRGRIAASGPLAMLQADPSLPLLSAPEAAITINGQVSKRDETYALTTFDVSGGMLLVPGLHGSPGRPMRLRIAASDVSFSLAPPVDTTVLNCLPCRILSVTVQKNGSGQADIVAGLGEDGAGAQIVARITRKSQEALRLAEGKVVFAQIKSVALLASAGASHIRQAGSDLA